VSLLRFFRRIESKGQNMKHSLWLVLGVILSGWILAGALASATDEERGGGLFLRNLRVFDAHTGAMTEPQDIFIEDGRIKAMGPLDRAPGGAGSIDCGGRYALPGLFDCHTHVAHLATMSDEERAAGLRALVEAGITAVRDVGGPVDVLAQMNAAIASGARCGPEIFFTGPMLEASPLTWESQNENLPGFTVAVDTVDDVDRIVPELARKGARMVKTFGKHKREVYAHLVATAKKHGLRVVHDPGEPLFHSIPMDEAIGLGVASIEHGKAPWPVVLVDALREEHDALMAEKAGPMRRMAFMSKVCQQGAESVDRDRLKDLAVAMVRHDAYFCPTLQVLAQMKEEEPWRDQPAVAQNMMKRMIAAMEEVSVLCTIELARHGVKLLVGQDGYERAGTFREMRFLKECGVAEAEILRGATLYPARWLGIEERLGSIAPGKEATLLIVDQNPLDSIENIASTHLVIRKGAVAFRAEQGAGKPTPEQIAWHAMEMEMFVCLDPCTWQNREYDDHSTPLSEINPEKLDTDQWCRVARSFGAKQILFVAKHTGGFCWWRTDTTDYGIKDTPWRDGKGDVLADLSASCRKHDLKLAIYVYPGDDTWGAPMGSGGRTRDPAKQEGYNKVFRQQMTEVLSRYGPISEVWFDGSCVIEVGDILKRYAPKAMVFQGPHATIRWPGNEKGIAPYPTWQTVKKKDALTGVSTQAHSDPEGDVWLPFEMDTTLLDHKWFWGENTDHMMKSVDHLMRIYYESVGRGCVLLLNSTPDTTGLIPRPHVGRYLEFAAEIERRFGKSLAETSGRGETVEIVFEEPTAINHVVIMEDIRNGHTVREYVIEGISDETWVELYRGCSVGYKKIDYFPGATVSRLRLRVVECRGVPVINRFAAFRVDLELGQFPDLGAFATAKKKAEWQRVAFWKSGELQGEWTAVVDLSSFITEVGQFELEIRQTGGDGRLESVSCMLLLEGLEAPDAIRALDRPGAYAISRSQVVAHDTKKHTQVRIVSRLDGNVEMELGILKNK